MIASFYSGCKHRVEFRMHSSELGVAGLNNAPFSEGVAICSTNEQAQERKVARNALGRLIMMNRFLRIAPRAEKRPGGGNAL